MSATRSKEPIGKFFKVKGSLYNTKKYNLL